MKSVTCPHCSKTFCSVSVRNRHIRKVHLLEVENAKQKTRRIFCPLCSDTSKQNLATYNMLMQHITDVHNIIVQKQNLSFPNHEEFESWRALEGRNVNYAVERSLNYTDRKIVYYSCNRSNSFGYQSSATKRMVKKSIKINGVCSSRIIANFINNGQVEVNFVETHVGHTSNLRNQRLTNAQKEELVKKLKAGIPKRRIIKEARKMKGKEEESDQQNLCIEEESEEEAVEFISEKAEKLNVDECRLENVSEEEAVEFISEKAEKLNVDECQLENVSEDKYREIMLQKVFSLIDDMPFETCKKVMNEILPIIERYSEGSCSKKRKMYKQSYLPNPKKQRNQ